MTKILQVRFGHWALRLGTNEIHHSIGICSLWNQANLILIYLFPTTQKSLSSFRLIISKSTALECHAIWPINKNKWTLPWFLLLPCLFHMNMKKIAVNAFCFLLIILSVQSVLCCLSSICWKLRIYHCKSSVFIRGSSANVISFCLYFINIYYLCMHMMWNAQSMRESSFSLHKT